MNADWVMVIITGVYVIATIFICWANIKAANASKEQLREMQKQFAETNRPIIDVYKRQLLAHAPRLVAGIFFQPIVFDCVVENRRELVVDALEIGLGVRLAVFIPVAGQGVLPLAHVSGLNLVQRNFLEERRYLQVDQPFLAGNGGWLEAVLHILDIQSCLLYTSRCV